jgi:hypothetical protein
MSIGGSSEEDLFPHLSSLLLLSSGFGSSGLGSGNRSSLLSLGLLCELLLLVLAQGVGVGSGGGSGFGCWGLNGIGLSLLGLDWGSLDLLGGGLWLLLDQIRDLGDFAKQLLASHTIP